MFTQEFRYSLRTLAKSPGFALTAVLTLALGIGASTAIFTVVDSVLLQPLGFHDSGRLVVTWQRIPFLSPDPTGPNPRYVVEWQRRAGSFEGISYLRHRPMGLARGEGHPVQMNVLVTYPNLFEVLRVNPLLGRTFRAGEGSDGSPYIVILGYALWQSLFRGDPNAIGKTIRMDDVPYEVIGVLPPDFHFPNQNALNSFHVQQQLSANIGEAAAVLPFNPNPAKLNWDGDFGNFVAIGRLKPGVAAAQVEAELNSIQAQLAREIPAGQSDIRLARMTARVQPMQEAVVGNSRQGLWFLFAAVTGLLLIACVNLANAQLGRALARQREAAVRTAIGAPRWRLIWGALAENLVLAAAGGGLGWILADGALTLFRRYSPVDLPRLSEVHLNLTVFLFALAVTLAASVLSGILPAMRFASVDPQASLQGGNRAFGSRGSSHLRLALIAVQVFGCTALLLFTGLFTKSLLNLLSQDRGFDTQQTVMAEVNLSPKTYDKDASRLGFADGVLANLRASPGIESAGLISSVPLEGERWIEFVQRIDRPKQQTPLINFRWVSPGYFETTKQRLIQGRFIEERDRTLNGIVFSQGEAAAIWGNENPLGAKVKIEGREFTVVGVVADSRNTSLKTAPPKVGYAHYNDRPPYTYTFLVRALGKPETLLPVVRQAIWKYAPDVTIAKAKTMSTQVSDSLATERFQTWVLLSFGAGALALAMLGIYGVLSYSVASRRPEIGIRLALGARRSSIYRLIFSETGLPVVAGTAAGLLVSTLAFRWLRSMLYGIQLLDPALIAIVAALLAASALAAAFFPARRAAAVDPMETLRSD